MPKVIGDVAVVINPDATGFRQLADFAIRKQLAGFRPDIKLGVNAKEVAASLTDLKARVKALSGSLTDLRIGADTKGAEAKVVALQAKLAALTKQMANITMGADTKKVDAAIAAEEAKLKLLQQQASKISLDMDDKKAVAKLLDLQKQAAHLQEQLGSGKINTKIDVKAAEAKIRALDAEIRVLKSNAQTVRVAAETKAINASIALVKSNIEGLKREARDIQLGANIDTTKLLAAEAALLGIEHTAQLLGQRDAPVANTAMRAFTSSMGRTTTAAAAGWKLLTGHIALFGGALNQILPKMFTSVAVWHLLADAVIETVAVWAPAIIAVTAFGVAGEDAARKVYNRMVAVHTVMDATGKAVPPLSNNFNKLAHSVQPEVYQLFGDALLIMNRRGGAFNQVATGTGRVLDQLAARFVYAVTTGGGVNKFMEHAVDDVAKLGDSIGNLGGIFGAVFRAVPGYAEILLTVGDGITRVLEKAASAAEPVIAFGLALHGAIIYGGAAVTFSLALVAGLVKVIAAFGKFNEAINLVGLAALKSFAISVANAVKSLVIYGITLVSLGAEEGVAAAGTILLADAMNLLTKVPVVLWLTLAASAIAAIVIALRSGHTAAGDFADGLQKTVHAASLTQVIPTILNAQAQATERLNAARTKLANTTEFQGAIRQGGQVIQQVTQAYQQQSKEVGILSDAQKQLQQQYQLVTGRVGGLAKEYGGQTRALGLLNAAGITTDQILDKNNQHWAQALIQVDATSAAYKAMGTQAGTLGNDLDVLGRTVTDQYQATQKLNQAWSTFITDVTSTQGSLDTVVQGFETLNTHSGELKLSLGKLKTAYADGKAAIDDLTPAGIALNQAFTDQVQNIDKLFASWRTAGLANNLFTQGVKAAIAPLTKYAKGSQEATAQLVALAQEAGYQGPVSLQALTKWLGNTHGATQKLKDITDQATTQEALLTGAMQAQGSYIASTLLRDINNAILKYNGVEAAAAAYGNAVAKSGRQSDAAHAARQTLINDIIKSGTAAGDSKGQIAAMITKVLGIPPKKALQIVMTGTGSFSLSQINAKTGKQQQAATGGYVNMAGRIMRAGGGFIDLGTGPTSDDVPAMLSRGEYVVRASSVAKYGKGTMDAINAGMFAAGGLAGKTSKFAAGGLVAHIDNAIFSGDTSVLTGQYVVNQETKFQTVMLAAQLSAMRKALDKAKADAQAQQSFSVSGFGPVGGDQAANKALARSMFPWPASMWPSYDYLEMREAGYNRFARNPSSGAYGIPQALPPTKMPFAAQAAGGSHAGPQLSWMYSYIRSVYGNPVNAAGHERSFNWYKHGGLVQKLAAGGLAGKFASGGAIPLARYLPQLKTAQHNEALDYGGLRKAYLADLKNARKGSWTSGHRAGITSELGTLAKHQAAEMTAYNAIIAHGTSAANLKAMAAKVKAVTTTSRDKDLVHNHPGWTHGLQYWLGVLSHLSQASVAPAYGGTNAKVGFYTWLAKAKTVQAHEKADYTGLEAAFKAGLRSAGHGTWLYKNRTAIGERLYAVAVKQNAEAAAWADLTRHASGSISDLAGLSARIARLGAQASAEAGSLQPSLLGHTPGGHPGWVKGLQAQLKALTSLVANPPYDPPWAPGNLGPSHTAPGGVLTFDRGGLWPSGTFGWNGSGKTETVIPGGAGAQEIHIHMHNHGVIGSQRETDAWLTNSVNRLARTGYLTQAVKRAGG